MAGNPFYGLEQDFAAEATPVQYDTQATPGPWAGGYDSGVGADDPYSMAPDLADAAQNDPPMSEVAGESALMGRFQKYVDDLQARLAAATPRPKEMSGWDMFASILSGGVHADTLRRRRAEDERRAVEQQRWILDRAMEMGLQEVNAERAIQELDERRRRTDAEVLAQQDAHDAAMMRQRLDEAELRKRELDYKTQRYTARLNPGGIPSNLPPGAKYSRNGVTYTNPDVEAEIREYAAKLAGKVKPDGFSRYSEEEAYAIAQQRFGASSPSMAPRAATVDEPTMGEVVDSEAAFVGPTRQTVVIDDTRSVPPPMSMAPPMDGPLGGVNVREALPTAEGDAVLAALTRGQTGGQARGDSKERAAIDAYVKKLQGSAGSADQAALLANVRQQAQRLSAAGRAYLAQKLGVPAEAL